MIKRYISLITSLILLLSSMTLETGAAVSSTASVPVTLTVKNEYRQVNVTVPASLPIEVINGTVITADSAVIRNNSTNTKVKVTAITVKGGEYAIGNYDSFTGEGTIALKINGAVTRGEGAMNLSSSSFGIIEPGKSEALKYYAKVAASDGNSASDNAATVVFTISVVD